MKISSCKLCRWWRSVDLLTHTGICEGIDSCVSDLARERTDKADATISTGRTHLTQTFLVTGPDFYCSNFDERTEGQG